MRKPRMAPSDGRKMMLLSSGKMASMRVAVPPPRPYPGKGESEGGGAIA
jgi:hypothetical protein